MKKTTILTIAVVALIFMNVILMGFMFLTVNPVMQQQQNRPEPRQIIIERLGFDENQQQEYAKLIERHRREVNRLDKEIRKAKNSYYSGIGTMNETEQDNLLQTLTELHKNIEQVHYAHFVEISKLCKGEQVTRFKELAPELPRIFGPPPPPERKS